MLRQETGPTAEIVFAVDPASRLVQKLAQCCNESELDAFKVLNAVCGLLVLAVAQFNEKLADVIGEYVLKLVLASQWDLAEDLLTEGEEANIKQK